MKSASPCSGGVHNGLSGQFTVADTVIRRNTADSGGGIYNTDVITATDTKIRRNTASDSGGGILRWVSITIPRSTKVNNHTPDDIYVN